MWIAALFGMATKYTEGVLAVKYREVDAKGQISGGPMYYIEKGLGKKWKPLAVMFAIFGTLTAMLGNGTFTQVNAITSSLNLTFNVPIWLGSTLLTILVAIIILGGLKTISKAAEKIVPFMSVTYFIITIVILGIYHENLPFAIMQVFEGATSGTAAMGGFAGASVMLAIRSGVARGVFSNESGLGSAPIAAAAAKTEWPAEQGLISMTGTFIDTIIICTMTGLTLVVSGFWTTDLNGAALTRAAFMEAFPIYGSYMLMIGLCLFAFTTILGWNYYGERCIQYLAGVKAILPYRIVFILIIASTPFMKLEEIWVLADIVNGLMAIPNLIALIALSGVVVVETKKYMDHLAEKKKLK